MWTRYVQASDRFRVVHLVGEIVRGVVREEFAWHGFAWIGRVDSALLVHSWLCSRRSCPSGILSRPLHLEQFEHC